MMNHLKAKDYLCIAATVHFGIVGFVLCNAPDILKRLALGAIKMKG